MLQPTASSGYHELCTRAAPSPHVASPSQTDPRFRCTSYRRSLRRARAVHQRRDDRVSLAVAPQTLGGLSSRARSARCRHRCRRVCSRPPGWDRSTLRVNLRESLYADHLPPDRLGAPNGLQHRLGDRSPLRADLHDQGVEPEAGIATVQPAVLYRRHLLLDHGRPPQTLALAPAVRPNRLDLLLHRSRRDAEQVGPDRTWAVSCSERLRGSIHRIAGLREASHLHTTQAAALLLRLPPVPKGAPRIIPDD